MKDKAKNIFQIAKNFVFAHKVVSVISAIVLLFLANYTYKKVTDTSGETKYIMSQASVGTILSTISGTGQVSSSNQVDLKAKVSGDVATVYSKAGDEVKSGKVILALDDSDGRKAVRDAEANLLSAKISLEKVKEPADNLSIIQAENSLAQAQVQKTNSLDDLKKAYDDSYNAISNAFLDMPSIVSGLNDILYKNEVLNNSYNVDAYSDLVYQIDNIALEYKNDTVSKYKIAKASYDLNFTNYKLSSRSSNYSEIESLLNETYLNAKNISDSIKSSKNLIDFYVSVLKDRNIDPNPVSATHLNVLNTYTTKINSHIQLLLSYINTIQNAKDSIDSAERTIKEKTEYLKKLQNGATDLDIQSAELSVKQKENALYDAKEKLSYYYIRAPFDATVAKVNFKKLDSVTSGSIIGTVVTKSKMAEITLSEVDISKIRAGQKVNLTFDAVSDLNITGIVSEVDGIGTMSQGVVNYAVKIIFDTDDERIKPGMSVNASIITDIKTDVLKVPNSAIKSSNGNYYIEAFENIPGNATSSAGFSSIEIPVRKIVEIGLASDDATEIISGLKEGDYVITRTILPTTKTSTTPSLFGGNNNQLRVNTGGAGGQRNSGK